MLSCRMVYEPIESRYADIEKQASSGSSMKTAGKSMRLSTRAEANYQAKKRTLAASFS